MIKSGADFDRKLKIDRFALHIFVLFFLCIKFEK